MVYIHFESGWEQYPLSLDRVDQLSFQGEWKEGMPGFFRYEFDAAESADTFLDCSSLGKGVAFINGFHLGRYWSEGPVCYLYIPAPLLKAGKNELILFETEGKLAEELELKDYPVYRQQ